ncbi:MAG: hypothetical protein EOO41_00360 [Methanobacteriota archaeon]|nr:MAG: hypothetical protein EOO41_00360 [Euryarchaeota archaeon]
MLLAEQWFALCTEERAWQLMEDVRAPPSRCHRRRHHQQQRGDATHMLATTACVLPLLHTAH